MGHGIALDSPKSGRAHLSDDVAVRRVQRLIGKKLIKQNPNFKIDIERRIADFPKKLERLEELKKKIEINQENTTRLLAASAERLGWPTDGTSLSPSRDWPNDVAISCLAPSEQTAWRRDQAIRSHLNLINVSKNSRASLENVEQQKQNAINLHNFNKNQLSMYFD